MQLYVSLGANIGQREENLHRALRALEQRVGTLLKCSSFVETQPVDFDSPNAFLNAAALFETSLSAEEILDITQEIEREIGRTRKSHNGIHYDRCIDIDLLMLDDQIVNTERLSLPHPRMTERLFVLNPLAEIAPELQHPQIGISVCELLRRLSEEVPFSPTR